MHFLPNITVQKIMHIADIHLPGINQGETKCKRTKEYEFAIHNLVKDASMLHDCDAICVIAGDIFDRANHNPAASGQLFQELIFGISKYIPIFIIAGNHDFDTKQFNSNEPHIGDFIRACLPPNTVIDSPSYDSNRSNYSGNFVVYLSKSGYYEVGTNIGLGVYTAQDIYKHTVAKTALSSLRVTVPPQRDYMKSESEQRINFALYHGSIDSHKLATSKAFFTGYDYGLMGDIHYFCVNGVECEPNTPIRLTPGFSYVYPGSILQINSSENTYRHGYALWDITNHRAATVMQKELEQECGIVTLALCDRGIDTYCTTRARTKFCSREEFINSHELPKRLSIVLRCNGSKTMLSSSKRQEIISAFKSQGIDVDQNITYAQSSIITTQMNQAPADQLIRPSTLSSQPPSQSVDGVFDSLVIDCSYLGKFIKQKLENEEDEEIDDIISMSNTLMLTDDDAATMTGDALTKFTALQNKLATIKAMVNRSSVIEDRGTFKLISAEWDYILVYGTGNYINFTSADSRVVLIDGKNNYGKSSILEVIYFGLYSECAKLRSGNDSQMVSTFTQEDKMMGATRPIINPGIKITFSLKGERYHIITTFDYDKASTEEVFDSESFTTYIYKKRVRLYKQSSDGEFQLIAGGADARKWVDDNVINKDTFLRVCMVTQTNDCDFFSLTNSEQYKSLERMFNIDMTGNMLKYIETSIECYDAFMTNAKNCIDIYSRAPYPIDFEPQGSRDDAIKAISQEYEYSQDAIDCLTDLTNGLRVDIARLTSAIGKHKTPNNTVLADSATSHPIDMNEVYYALTGNVLDESIGSELDHYRDLISKIDEWMSCDLYSLTKHTINDVGDCKTDMPNDSTFHNMRQAPLIAQKFHHLYAEYEALCAHQFSADIGGQSTYTHVPHFNSVEEWHSMENTLKILLAGADASVSSGNKFFYADVPAIRVFINRCIELSGASHAISAKYEAHRAEGNVLKSALIDELTQTIRAPREIDVVALDSNIAELASGLPTWRFASDEELRIFTDALIKMRQYTILADALSRDFDEAKQAYVVHLSTIDNVPFNENCDACHMQPHNIVKHDMELKVARILEQRMANLRNIAEVNLLLSEYTSSQPSVETPRDEIYVMTTDYYTDIVIPFVTRYPAQNGNNIHTHITKIVNAWRHLKTCNKLLELLTTTSLKDNSLIHIAAVDSGLCASISYCGWTAKHTDLAREVEAASLAYREHVSAHAAHINRAIEMIRNEWQIYERRRLYELNQSQRNAVGSGLAQLQKHILNKHSEYTALGAKCKHDYSILINELAAELESVVGEYKAANAKLAQINARRDGYNRAVYNYDDNCKKYENIMELNYRYDEVLDLRTRFFKLLPLMKEFQNDVFDKQIMPSLSKRITQLLHFITHSDSESVTLFNHKMPNTHRFEVYHQDRLTGTRCQISKLGGYKSSLIAFILRIVMQCVLSRDNVCCRQLFIDEAFNAADGYNIQDVPALLRHLISAGVYDSILFVTHNAYLKEEFGEDSITITKPVAKCSSVQYGIKPLPPILNNDAFTPSAIAPVTTPDISAPPKRRKCSGTTKKGEPCKNPPKGETSYCYAHSK